MSVYISDNGKIRYDLGCFDDMVSAGHAIAELPELYQDGKPVFIDRCCVIVDEPRTARLVGGHADGKVYAITEDQWKSGVVIFEVYNGLDGFMVAGEESVKPTPPKKARYRRRPNSEYFDFQGIFDA